MITLASLIERFEADCLARYQLLPSHRQALAAMKRCRTSMAPRMLAQCSGCDEQLTVPHSCGHRSCPHCQQFESQRWLERQTQRLVAGDYFLVTFLHPNSKRLIALLRLLVFRTPSPEQPTQRPTLVCRCCGAPMTILRRCMPPVVGEPPGAASKAQDLSK